MPPSRELAILGACAMPRANARQRARLADLMGGPVLWDELISLAVDHNMTGLAWQHLNECEALPADARLKLMALRLRQRALIRVQETALARLLDIAAAMRIEVMLLKGAALRRLVYADPELRAMRDIDVLASPGDGQRLWDGLVDAGFLANDPDTHPLHHPGLEWREGPHGVGVDVHWIAHAKWPAGFDDLAGRAVRIEVLGRSTLAPSRLDLLRHVFLHCFGSDLWLGSRLVAIADLVGMLDAWGDTFEPRQLSRRDSALVRALGWLDLLAPLSDAARAHVGRVGRSKGVGELYQGWPLAAAPRPLQSWRDFVATFAPSPWWLRLRFRAQPGVPPLAWAWLRHVHQLAEVWW